MPSIFEPFKKAIDWINETFFDASETTEFQLANSAVKFSFFVGVDFIKNNYSLNKNLWFYLWAAGIALAIEYVMDNITLWIMGKDSRFAHTSEYSAKLNTYKTNGINPGMSKSEYDMPDKITTEPHKSPFSSMALSGKSHLLLQD